VDMGHRRNGIYKEKPKYWEKNLSLCQFVHHKFHTERPVNEPDSSGDRPETNTVSISHSGKYYFDIGVNMVLIIIIIIITYPVLRQSITTSVASSPHIAI